MTQRSAVAACIVCALCAGSALAQEEPMMDPPPMEQPDMPPPGDGMPPPMGEDAPPITGADPENPAVQATPVALDPDMPDAMELADLDPPYVAFADVEYTPLRAAMSGPKVQDLGDPPGVNATSATECAMMCNEEPECNMATWAGNYPDWNEEFPANCFLKVIEEPCSVPEEAEDYPDLYLLMQQDDCEAPVPGLAPLMAPEAAVAPFADDISAIPGTPPALVESSMMPPSMAPGDDAPGDRSLGDGAGTPAGGPAEAPSSALGLAGGVAVAVVALSALLA